ncbi:MAG: ubiquinol-cytochrome c reductase iron-sulfur subunit [Candidatus Omnitrophota bacterium]|nr:ubiquinol-cytochrome c reductase iron-sulfur subunit [Candidatus Omnitrophota bacterium]
MSEEQPKPPSSPPASAPKTQPPVSVARRHFLFTWLGFAWTGFAAATLAALSTCLRFMFPNVLFEPNPIFNAGKPDDYDIGKVDLRWKEKYAVWLVREPEGMYALSTVCTHLGCTPSWMESEQKFKCPCHGSGFYASGINFEGPAPRPLERYAIRLGEDGNIIVDKSRKFQQEKGEWNQPDSFLYL